MLRIPQIHFFFLTALTAQTAQTEEFLFQNVAYGLTVYRTGAKTISIQKKFPIKLMTSFLMIPLNFLCAYFLPHSCWKSAVAVCNSFIYRKKSKIGWHKHWILRSILCHIVSTREFWNRIRYLVNQQQMIHHLKALQIDWQLNF